MAEPADLRRRQRNHEQPTADRQVVLMRLKAFHDGETSGPVFHAKKLLSPTYPATAGAATLTYTESMTEELCWVQDGMFAVGDVVLAVVQSNRYYAVGKME